MYKAVLRLIFILLLTNSVYSKAYKGAEYRTLDDYLYGRFESCYKPPVGTGMLATFFTYRTFSGTLAEWNEIDIEILGRYDNNIQFTTITPYQHIYDSHTYLDFNPADDYHVYAFEWTPDYIAWFIDDVEYYRQTLDHVSTLQLSQKIMANVWAPDEGNLVGGWTGLWNPEILPLFTFYDWISYSSYTPGSGTSGTDNNFTLEWTDELDSMDTSRWKKSDGHTWGGNRVDMIAENIIFKDGKMILALTDENNTGYVDNNPPVILWARADNDELTVKFSEQVDSLSATNLSNYNIPGIELKSVEFQEDKRTVKIQTSSFDTASTYQVVLFGLTDISENHNVNSYTFETIQVTKYPKFPLKINVGGNSIYNSSYIADQVWLPEVEYGHMDGTVKSWTVDDIAGTEEDSLYLSGVRKVVKYKINVPKGIYDVTLHFAENVYDSVGARVFSTYIEDTKVIDALDIFAQVGMNTAYDVKAENIEVKDNVLEIHFSHWIAHPILCGITVEQISDALPNNKDHMPKSLKLFQNYPNPFNPNTILAFELPEAKYVELNVYNNLGQKIDTLLRAYKNPGIHKIEFDGQTYASGVYYYEIKTKDARSLKKMILIK